MALRDLLDDGDHLIRESHGSDKDITFVSVDRKAKFVQLMTINSTSELTWIFINTSCKYSITPARLNPVNHPQCY